MVVLVLCGYCWCFVVIVCAWFKNTKFVLDSGERGDKTKKKHSCVVDHQVGVQVNHDVSIEDIMCAKVSNDDHVSVNKEDICSFAAKVGTDASVGLANEGSGTSATVYESYTTNNYALIHSRPISYAKLVTDEASRKNVKFHGVPITAFSEDGLSIIATKLGISLMLDSYTSDMCMQSWHTSSYARAMIDLRADGALKDTIVVAIPILIGEGFNMIDKFERQMIEGKFLLVDDDGKPLPNVVSTVNANSDSEVEEVFDEHATFMASTGLKRSSDSSYGTNSLWEQWRETKQDDNYDPYDDDLYDSH
ncbi:hypothetical protein Tco_0715234 [Tanacetum coccineum]